jgi:hypothetical protein
VKYRTEKLFIIFNNVCRKRGFASNATDDVAVPAILILLN